MFLLSSNLEPPFVIHKAVSLQETNPQYTIIKSIISSPVNCENVGFNRRKVSASIDFTKFF